MSHNDSFTNLGRAVRKGGLKNHELYSAIIFLII